MSIEAQSEIRLKSIIQPNSTDMGVDLPKGGTVEEVTKQSVCNADQTSLHT
jgi:hypothetical protein